MGSVSHIHKIASTKRSKAKIGMVRKNSLRFAVCKSHRKHLGLNKSNQRNSKILVWHILSFLEKNLASYYLNFCLTSTHLVHHSHASWITPILFHKTIPLLYFGIFLGLTGFNMITHLHPLHPCPPVSIPALSIPSRSSVTVRKPSPLASKALKVSLKSWRSVRSVFSKKTAKKQGHQIGSPWMRKSATLDNTYVPVFHCSNI